MNKEIKKYIDNLDSDHLREMLKRLTDIEKHVCENYTGNEKFINNHIVTSYIKYKLSAQV